MPRVYVGTYKKYNEGSLAGDWIDLDEYSDEDSFYERAREIHSDEDDPEFMFQDWEDIPKGLISESGIDDRLWEWLELDEDERDAVREYWDEIDSNASIRDIIDNYHGQHKSMVDFAEELAYEIYGGAFKEYPNLEYYFDFNAFARDLEADYIITKSGYVFSSF